MSLDIERINGLLSIVKEASGHPAKLGGLVAMAMKELEGHSNDAKIEHDKIIAQEQKDAAAKKADEAAKAKKLAEEDAKKAELTSRPVPKPTSVPTARPAVELPDEPEPETEVKRRGDA